MPSLISWTVIIALNLLGPPQSDDGFAAGEEPAKPPTTQPASANKPLDGEAARAELERKFAETLTNSVLEGSWQLIEGDKLGEARADKYTIIKAQKLGGDFWVITARIEYADKDVTVPLPLRIVWSGDTPVITVTDFPVPGIGTYSARVMIYRNLYAGTWFGVGYGGVMSGMISRPKPDEPVEKTE
jgi:hypothetical protein